MVKLNFKDFLLDLFTRAAVYRSNLHSTQTKETKFALQGFRDSTQRLKIDLLFFFVHAKILRFFNFFESNYTFGTVCRS